MGIPELILPLFLTAYLVCGTRPVTDTKFVVKPLPAQNARPMIGILTQPGDLAQKGESYFSAGYVKWLESAGARVVPILYDLSKQEVKNIFKVLDGVVFPGGNYPLSLDTRWFRTGTLLFDLAKEANNRGDVFPILGTCLGLQLLSTIITGDENVLQPVDSHDMPTHLNFTADAESSRFLGKVPKHVLRNFATQDIAMHNHHYGLTVENYPNYPEMEEFFTVLSHTTDRQGVQYASIIEGKKYPFTGLAFHPEKVPYEWTPQLHIPHTPEAVEAVFQLATAFVSLARQSHQAGQSIVQEDAIAIYNFPAQFYGKHFDQDDDLAFEQVYIFRLDEYRRIVHGSAAAF